MEIDDAGDSLDADRTVQRLHPSEQDAALALSRPQMDRLHSFLDQKQKMGDICAEDLERISELGTGSGGVVMRVRHRRTNQTMARKVSRRLVDWSVGYSVSRLIFVWLIDGLIDW